ncbi:MAG: hypothetical protein HYY46_04830 [Deltaproteobacteria bacterium]|nr:hypothetical protein [Deltaproteobacteria bacterium]
MSSVRAIGIDHRCDADVATSHSPGLLSRKDHETAEKRREDHDETTPEDVFGLYDARGHCQA